MLVIQGILNFLHTKPTGTAIKSARTISGLFSVKKASISFITSGRSPIFSLNCLYAIRGLVCLSVSDIFSKAVGLSLSKTFTEKPNFLTTSSFWKPV